MGKIIIYDVQAECHSTDPNNFSIGDGSVLSNPFKCNGKRTNLQSLTFRTHNEASEAFSNYFDYNYANNKEFKDAVDLLYGRYKDGQNIYLQCSSDEDEHHGKVIARKITSMLLKERLSERKKEKR